MRGIQGVRSAVFISLIDKVQFEKISGLQLIPEGIIFFFRIKAFSGRQISILSGAELRGQRSYSWTFGIGPALTTYAVFLNRPFGTVNGIRLQADPGFSGNLTVCIPFGQSLQQGYIAG